MKCKYKPGDKVRVRQDLHKFGSYKMVSGTMPGCNLRVSNSMCSYAGKIATVSDCGIAYVLEGFGGWAWSDEMLEPVKPLCCKSLL